MDRTSHQPTTCVIGDIMIDHYLWGKCERISPEAPVQVVEVTREEERLGGACNVMQNLVALGAKVHGCGIVGYDKNGQAVIQMLEVMGVSTGGCIYEENRPTIKKSRIIAGNQQVVRVDREQKHPILQESALQIATYVKSHLSEFDAILLSDYAKGVLEPDLCQQIIQMAKKANIPILVDPKGKNYEKYQGASLITPNRKEAEQASGIECQSDTQIEEVARWMKQSFDLFAAVITLSEDGMAILDESFEKIPTVAREVYDVTGAGDTVLAAFGYSLANHWGLRKAARFANSAAAVVVGKVGSATVTLEEIDIYERNLHQNPSTLKIKSQDEIREVSEELHRIGKKVVFTNGCFDLLHVGHIDYLEKAKALGDVLILGLNSDSSVQKLKGPSRPIHPESDRSRILAALECVDYIVLFEEETPIKLIEKVQPDILVKGGDYEGQKIIGSDIAKEVKLLSFIEGRSTTSIIEKIQQQEQK